MPNPISSSTPLSGGAPLADVRSGKVLRNCLAILAAAFIWLLVTKVFWVGYVGADDIFYARYAFVFHRVPINWWEVRLPAILSIRAAFLLFGPNELAAALPTLMAAFAAAAAIGWYVGWPEQLTWKTNAAVLFAITLPLDVTFRTVPGATYMAGGILIVGSVCILKGGRFATLAGCACIAAAISTHEISMFYAGIFLGTALAFDRRRFLRPALLSVLFTVVALGAQAAYYAKQFGDPLLRFHLAAAESAHVSGLYDPDTKLAGLGFLLWPVKTMLFSKVFACDLLIVFVLGSVYWRKLLLDQRILLISGFLTWFYLGFGTKIPWAYRPLARMYHFYGPLVLMIAVLLPVCIDHWSRTTHRPGHWAFAGVVGILALHLACLAGGGRWGQDVRVSRVLLGYASNHPASTFLTDYATMNQMYAQNGFELPRNVVCVDGPVADRNLLVNKEPSGRIQTSGVKYPDQPIDGILVNLNAPPDGDRDFQTFRTEHPGSAERIAPVRYKPIFTILPAFVKRKDFAIASDGAELIRLH